VRNRIESLLNWHALQNLKNRGDVVGSQGESTLQFHTALGLPLQEFAGAALPTGLSNCSSPFRVNPRVPEILASRWTGD
jgi:hypothetical protein